MSVSAVLLSWDRLRQLHDILDHLKALDFIDEIIVWNNNPAVAPFVDERAKVINSSHDMGMWTRFAAASLARNEHILYHDDDLIIDVDDMEQLYRAFCADDSANHGLSGRNPTESGEYTFNNIVGKCEITLTRCVFTKRERAVKALAHVPEFDKIPSKLRGNGEDIVLSYATEGWNYSYKFQCRDSGGDKNAIHKKFPDHKQVRSRIVRKCWDIWGRPGLNSQ